MSKKAPVALTSTPATAPKAETIRLASGRLARMKKGETLTPARFNALLEDLEAIGKRINAIERGVPAKTKDGIVQKSGVTNA